jgi:hypothetical protein
MYESGIAVVTALFLGRQVLMPTPSEDAYYDEEPF